MEQRVSLHYVAVPEQRWPALEAEWLPRLPPAKSALIERLRHAADRNASLLGLALAARAHAALGLPFDPAAIDFPPRGKPRVSGGADFSIAHTRGRVLAAVADHGQVGVDVECRDAVRPATVRRVIHVPDWRESAPGAPTATELWVMGEAAAKLAGAGIRGLPELDFDVAAGRVRLGALSFGLQPVDVGSGYVAYLASDGARPRVSVVTESPVAFAPLPASA